jgi:hypothetical protein
MSTDLDLRQSLTLQSDEDAAGADEELEEETEDEDLEDAEDEADATSVE